MTTKAHSLQVVCFSYKKLLHASPEEGFNASHQASRVLIRAQKSPSSSSRSSVHMATSGIYPTAGVPRKGLFSSKQPRRKFPRKHHPVKIAKKQVRNSRALMDLKLRATRKKSPTVCSIHESRRIIINGCLGASFQTMKESSCLAKILTSDSRHAAMQDGPHVS